MLCCFIVSAVIFVVILRAVVAIKRWISHHQFRNGGAYPFPNYQWLWDIIIIPFLYCVVSLCFLLVILRGCQFLPGFSVDASGNGWLSLRTSGQLAGMALVLWLTIGSQPLVNLKEAFHEDLVILARRDWRLQIPTFSLGLFTLVAMLPAAWVSFLVNYLDVTIDFLSFSVSFGAVVVVLLAHYWTYFFVVGEGGVLQMMDDDNLKDMKEVEFFEKVWIPISISYIRSIKNHRDGMARHLSAWLLYFYKKRYRDDLCRLENLAVLEGSIALLKREAQLDPTVGLISKHSIQEITRMYEDEKSML